MKESEVAFSTFHVFDHTTPAAPHTVVTAEPIADATPAGPPHVAGAAGKAVLPVVQHGQFVALLTVPVIVASLYMVCVEPPATLMMGLVVTKPATNATCCASPELVAVNVVATLLVPAFAARLPVHSNTRASPVATLSPGAIVIAIELAVVNDVIAVSIALPALVPVHVGICALAQMVLCVPPAVNVIVPLLPIAVVGVAFSTIFVGVSETIVTSTSPSIAVIAVTESYVAGALKLDTNTAALIDSPENVATTNCMYRASTAFGNVKVTFVLRSVFPEEPTIVVHAAASEEYFTENDVTQ